MFVIHVRNDKISEIHFETMDEKKEINKTDEEKNKTYFQVTKQRKYGNYNTSYVK